MAYGYSKSDANKAAKSLVERLGGEWKSKVWENMGWHYNTTNGGLTISEFQKVDGSMCYHTYLSDRPPGGTWVGEGSTPLEAIHDALKQARPLFDAIWKAQEEAVRLDETSNG